MQSYFRHNMRKHNGFIALFLSLILVISGSLQLVHDQLVDHHHDIDCAMYALDGNTPISQPSTACLGFKQPIEEQRYSPVSLVLTQFKQHAPRAPPALL